MTVSTTKVYKICDDHVRGDRSPGCDDKLKFASLRMEGLELHIVISVRHQSLHNQSIATISCPVIIHPMPQNAHTRISYSFYIKTASLEILMPIINLTIKPILIHECKEICLLPIHKQYALRLTWWHWCSHQVPVEPQSCQCLPGSGWCSELSPHWRCGTSPAAQPLAPTTPLHGCVCVLES